MTQGTLNVAISAARKAGNVLLRYFARPADLQIEEKGPNDYVCDADIAAERVIVEVIKEFFPDHEIMAEEENYDGKGDEQWIIDPLDGTHNFIRGNPHFAVSIAQRSGGITQHAVIYDPIRQDLYAASRGCSAYLNDRRMRVAQLRHLDYAIIGTALPCRHRKRTAALAEISSEVFSKSADIRISGSAALDLAFVASGKLDGYLETGLEPWDSAAGALLVRESGGIITDFQGGEKWRESGSVIAGNLRIAAALSKIARDKL